jgi:hypothetical protein
MLGCGGPTGVRGSIVAGPAAPRRTPIADEDRVTTSRPTIRPLGAAELIRSVGLRADGPVTWGRPVPSAGPGVYLVEWPEPLEAAPVELTLVGKWLERLPAMRLDGVRPTSREVAARLHAFWLPGQTVVYLGMTPLSIGGRVGAFYRTPLGDRKPHAGGHWLKTLRRLDRARIWWAETTAAEEYEDALLSAFAETVDPSPDAVPRLADRSVILPFANLQTATGVRKAHGITGAMEPAPPPTAVPGTSIVEVPEGSADGADESARVRPVVRRTPAAPPPAAPPPAASPPAAAASPADASSPVAAASSPVVASPGVALRGPAAREDLVALNDAVQGIACRRLVRELTVSEAAAELVAIGYLRATRADPVSVLRELLKAGVIEGGTQDPDRRWTIRCTRRPI